MILKALTLNNLETARQWRNQLMVAWRTPFMLTDKMQEDFYYNVICDRRSNLRYWAFYYDYISYLGFGGIENIIWENHTGEISIIIDPEQRGKGYGAEALRLILDQAFNCLNLDVVWAECFECNDSLGFWEKMGEKYKTQIRSLPYRKYWYDRMWDSNFYYFESWKKLIHNNHVNRGVQFITGGPGQMAGLWCGGGGPGPG